MSKLPLFTSPDSKTFLGVFALFTLATAASANDVRSLRVLSETPDTLQLEVEYVYSGNFGSNVWIGAEMANDGQSSRHYAYRPEAARIGNGTARIKLSAADSAPDAFDTNQIKIKMYVGSSFEILSEFYPRQKTWRKNPANPGGNPNPGPNANPGGNFGNLIPGLLPGLLPGIGGAQIEEDLLPFDPHRLRIQREGGEYLLTDGHSRMKMFPNRHEAQRALDTILHYGMNAHGFVGRPNPSVEYWLVDKRAPAGPMPGEDAIGFDPDNLEVKNVRGNWTLVEENHAILTFPTRAEGLKALAIIRKHDFHHIAFVGRPHASMTYFRK